MRGKEMSLESIGAVHTHTHTHTLDSIKEKRERIRNKSQSDTRGITLVALVVTIVVLLILAGVTLMYTMGDNGILKAAQDVKKQTEDAIKNEQQSLGNLANQLKEAYGGGNGDNNQGENTENPDNPNPDTPTGPTVDNSSSSEHTGTTVDYTWEQIDKIAQAIANSSNVTNETTEVTANVDGTSLKLGIGDIAAVTWNGTSKRVRVLGFKHDDLVDQTVYGGMHEKASISFEFYDCLGTHNMNGTTTDNSTNTNGWAATEMRTFLEGSRGRGQLSNNSYIKQVKKKYIKTYNDASSVTTSNDYLWLLSASEVLKDGYSGEDTRGYAITKEGEQYLYYQKNATEAWNSSSTNRVKYNNGSAYTWWLRSPYYNDSGHFCYADYTGGGNYNYYSDAALGVAPGFCI